MALLAVEDGLLRADVETRQRDRRPQSKPLGDATLRNRDLEQRRFAVLDVDHADGHQRHLAVAVSAQVVAVSVTDGGGTTTASKVKHQDQDAEHGRGLGMISVIAHRVVIHDSAQGHTVNAELCADALLGGPHAEATPAGLLVRVLDPGFD